MTSVHGVIDPELDFRDQHQCRHQSQKGMELENRQEKVEADGGPFGCLAAVARHEAKLTVLGPLVDDAGVLEAFGSVK